jgi:hypothetical protein
VFVLCGEERWEIGTTMWSMKLVFGRENKECWLMERKEDVSVDVCGGGF